MPKYIYKNLAIISYCFLLTLRNNDLMSDKKGTFLKFSLKIKIVFKKCLDFQDFL